MQIREDDLTGEAIVQLLESHLLHMKQLTPIESVHAWGSTRIGDEESRRTFSSASSMSHKAVATSPAFRAAQQLYERFGFVYCGPFGDYGEDPNRVFMRKDLRAALT